MQEDVTSRIVELKGKSFSELRAMPSPSDIHRPVENKSYTVTTWTELEDSGLLQVGVYAYFIGVLGIGTSVHDGFLILPDGTLKEMPVEMQVKCV